MSTYNISGGNQGAVGDNAHAENFTQNSMLVQDLAELRAEMTERARTPEQLASAQQVAEAHEAAKQGDDSKVGERLKAAGAWALKVATEIGKNVATKAISNQLGL